MIDCRMLIVQRILTVYVLRLICKKKNGIIFKKNVSPFVHIYKTMANVREVS